MAAKAVSRPSYLELFLKKLFLIDTYAFVFRSYYAIPQMENENGIPTNALYGFVSMVIKILRDHKPDYVTFCFDRKDGSFRNELYAEYKANRGDMPEDLIPQVPYLKPILDAFGLHHIDVKGFEADDIIGTLAQFGRENSMDTFIISSDKDFAQCVGPNITLFDPMRDNTYDVQGVVEKWGVNPEQMIDYLAICGDASDNVPGVKGIGPKGAQKLLAEYKDLEGIYNNIENISAKGTKAKLIESEDLAYLSKELVTIATSVEVNTEVDDLKLRAIDREKLVGLFDELGFKSFEKKLFGTGEGEPKDKKTKITTKPKKKKKKLVFNPTNFKEVSCTVDEAVKLMEPYTEVWALETTRGLYFQASKKIILLDGDFKELGKKLEGRHLKWKGFDLKSTWRNLGLINVNTPAWDHMLAAYTLNPSNIKTFEDVYENYTENKLPELSTALDYYNAHLELEAELHAALIEKNALEIYQATELQLVPVLYKMEQNGIYLDTDQLANQSKDLQTDLAKLEEQIHKEAGEAFNIASPKQLGQILFEKLKIPVVKKNKTGYSTSVDVLVKLADEYPIANMVIEYRELAKLKNTYVDALPELVDKLSSRIHTDFKQAVTSTGRLSSKNPNLQNIPIRTERGRLVRKAFAAPKGKVLLSIDYSQIELRVLAHITGDPGLCTAFKNDLDIHAATASEVFGVKLEDVSTDMRRKAKAVNFGIAYGQGAFGLAETLGISRGEAKEIIETYFKKFKKVKEYMEETVEKAKEDGFVTTLSGRKRYIKELQSTKPMIRKFGERAAINAPIQGTASDIVKTAMIKVFEEIDIPLLLQVHDELIFECPEDEVDEQMENIKKIMSETTLLNVPLKVNGAFGKNWDEAH